MKKLLIASISSLVLLWGCNDGNDKKVESKNSGPVNFPVSQREIFSLSMVSNLPAAIAWPYSFGLTEEQMADSIITYVSPFMDSTLLYAYDASGTDTFRLNNWTRVWGPGVIVDSMCDLCNDYEVKILGKLPGRARVPVSSMTIFRDASGNYVVGIEATNPSSVTDWVKLDLNVFRMKQFDDDPGHGKLSEGTYIGLNDYLLALTDMKTKQTAMQFLESLADMKSLTVTGHSLGGALSPVLALHLQNRLKNKSFNNSNIYCLATAGASPGDMTFIDYFNKQMGGNTVRIWNSLDVVPHAWEIDTMDRIDSIYAASSSSISFDSPYNCQNIKVVTQPFSGLATPGDIKGAVATLVGKLSAQGLVYGSICNGGQTFNGTQIAGSLYFNTTPLTDTTWMDREFPDAITFIDQLGNQHVAAYSMFFNIVGIHNYMHGWTTGNRLKNGVANWKCNPEYRACITEIPINILAPASEGIVDKRTVALWGRIQKAAWRR